MLRRFSTNFALFSILIDGLVVVFSLWSAATFRPLLNVFSFIERLTPPVLVPPALYVLFPLTWLVIFSALAIYDGKKYLRAGDEFSGLTLGMVIASVSAAGILYFSYRDVSRALYVVFVLQMYLLSLGWRGMARWYFRIRSSSPRTMRRILVIGSGPLGQRVGDQIQKSTVDGFSIVGFIDDQQSAVGRYPFLGGTGKVRSVINEQAVSDVVIALPHSAYHQLGDVVQLLEDIPVRVWVALGFFDLTLYETEIADFAGIPMLDLRASAIDDYQRMLKRAFDMLIGSLALILTLPVMGVLALAVLVEDGPPVLFRQLRAGENGRLFEMLKFRTMIRDAEKLRAMAEHTDRDGNLIHKSRADPRVTRIGRFLRRFSLDELPQLFNILTGTICLVGPRPEMPYLVEKYQPWQRKLFAVPPGLTGWWQVNGRSDRPMHLNTEDDLYYIQNYSIWLDLQILVRTLWVVLVGRGSY